MQTRNQWQFKAQARHENMCWVHEMTCRNSQHNRCYKTHGLLLHPFNSLFSRTSWVSWYQKRKKQSGFKWSKRRWGFGDGSGISWTICKQSAPCSRQILHQHLIPQSKTNFIFTQQSQISDHTHPFNGPFSGTNRVSRYQKGKTNLDFTEARDSEWQWHQLGHMQVCISLQTDNHASTPPHSFLHAGYPSCRPTNSVKALKA